jgi:hypothetical protein
MTKVQVRKMALREAGAWLLRDADSNDLDDGLSEDDEDEVRKAIRFIAHELSGKEVLRHPGEGDGVAKKGDRK